MDNVFGLLTAVGAGYRFTKVVGPSDLDSIVMPMAAYSPDSILVFVNGLYQGAEYYVADGVNLRATQRPWLVGDRVDVMWLQGASAQTPRAIRQLKGFSTAGANVRVVETPFAYTLGGSLDVYVDGLLLPPDRYVETDSTHITLVLAYNQQTRLDFKSYY